LNVSAVFWLVVGPSLKQRGKFSACRTEPLWAVVIEITDDLARRRSWWSRG